VGDFTFSQDVISPATTANTAMVFVYFIIFMFKFLSS